jgi:hypothetical protein
MAALFVAHGAGLPPRGRAAADSTNVDVYPLLAKLVGVAPRPNDGTIGSSRARWRNSGSGAVRRRAA